MRNPEPDGEVIARGGDPDAEMVWATLLAADRDHPVGRAEGVARLVSAARAYQALRSARRREERALREAMER